MEKKYYTVKELSESPLFPYKERRIRHFINVEKSLKVERISSQKIIIPEEEVLKFLKIKKNDK